MTTTEPDEASILEIADTLHSDHRVFLAQSPCDQCLRRARRLVTVFHVTSRCAAEPTTDGLAEEEFDLTVSGTISELVEEERLAAIIRHEDRIRAHDAALAEMRDEMHALRSEYSMHVMVPLDEYDRLAAVDPFAHIPAMKGYGFVGTSTPPAVPEEDTQ